MDLYTKKKPWVSEFPSSFPPTVYPEEVVKEEEPKIAIMEELHQAVPFSQATLRRL